MPDQSTATPLVPPIVRRLSAAIDLVTGLPGLPRLSVTATNHDVSIMVCDGDEATQRAAVDTIAATLGLPAATGSEWATGTHYTARSGWWRVSAILPRTAPAAVTR